MQQNFQVGGDYRSLYVASNSSKQILGIAEDKVINSQIFATAPDQSVLLNTATAFLQGLYPPLEGINSQIASQTLNNGSTYVNPLNGYQYVVLHGEENESPNTIWLKGDESCPTATKSSNAFKKSAEFQSREKATKSFYNSFWEIMQNVYDYSPSNMTRMLTTSSTSSTWPRSTTARPSATSPKKTSSNSARSQTAPSLV